MAKQKTIPQLEAEKTENERKLSQLQHKKQQLENRITYYEKDRHKQTHHLITRGAVIESVASLTKVLPETEFYAFSEKALAVPEIMGLLMDAVNKHNRAEQKHKLLLSSEKPVRASSVWNRRSGAWESLIACLSASMRTMWQGASTMNGFPR